MTEMNRFNRQLLVIAALVILTLVACAPADSSGDAPADEASGQPSETVLVKGEVKSISAKMWNVSGRELAIGDEADIQSDIQVGDSVEVRGRSEADGSMTVTQIAHDLSAAGVDTNSNDDAGDVNGNGNDDDVANGNDDDAANGNDNDDDDANGNDNDDDAANGNDDDDDAANGNDDDDDDANGNDDDDDAANGNDDDDDNDDDGDD